MYRRRKTKPEDRKGGPERCPPNKTPAAAVQTQSAGRHPEGRNRERTPAETMDPQTFCEYEARIQNPQPQSIKKEVSFCYWGHINAEEKKLQNAFYRREDDLPTLELKNI
ncbi:hypothetical protein NDU88_006292 [Pleurodeles waltl]|uniref:Uncharacterized protein n=1 Tax=Pleurodeles waltl TaxID=8319 RepID=A0AAV7NTQ1_PLEWA|nr:hypothetical protein NDU88_006292 [Pleurodeles waltl]